MAEEIKLRRSSRVIPARDRNVQVRLTKTEHIQIMTKARELETSAGKIVRDLLRAAGVIGE